MGTLIIASLIIQFRQPLSQWKGARWAPSKSMLSNDLVRRLSMMSENISMEERLGVVDHYTRKLKTSGYIQNQCKELVTSGVVGFRNNIKNRERNGQPFYRCAKATLGGRIRKKLTLRNTWYKKKSSDGQMAAFRGLNANGKPDKNANPRTKPDKNANPETKQGGLHASGGLHATGEKRNGQTRMKRR